MGRNGSYWVVLCRAGAIIVIIIIIIVIMMKCHVRYMADRGEGASPRG